MHAAGEDGDSLQGSNADSGRGTSEDGDMAAQFAAAAAAETRRVCVAALATVHLLSGLKLMTCTVQCMLVWPGNDIVISRIFCFDSRRDWVTLQASL